MVAVPELVVQHHIQHVHRHGNEAQAAPAYALPCATRADPVIVRHVNVKHKLVLGGLQHAGPQCLLVAGLCVGQQWRLWCRALTLAMVVDGTDLEAARIELDDLLFEVICRDEQVDIVAQVGVTGECKANSRCVKSLDGACLWLSHWKMNLNG